MKQTLTGRIVELGVLLHEFEEIEAHVLLHENTGCLCVEIYEDKVIAYENRAFITNKKELLEIERDMIKMHEEAAKADGGINNE